jgi:predicted Zn-dependent protease
MIEAARSKRYDGNATLKTLLILAAVLFFAAKFLPRLGGFLGGASRKPFRQAKWIWSWATGSEEESLAAEREYGRECAREFAAQFSRPRSPAHRDLVEKTGARLAAALQDPRREFRFSAVSSAISNAYALPGGFVFITEPLIDLCAGDPAEIAFFLGHEMGHILRGHAREQATAGVFLNAVTSRLPGTGRMLHELLGKGYARNLELDADREAVRLSRLAGFDPLAGLRAMQRLARISPDAAGLAEYFASHPPFADRIRELEKILRA